MGGIPCVKGGDKAGNESCKKTDDSQKAENVQLTVNVSDLQRPHPVVRVHNQKQSMGCERHGHENAKCKNHGQGIGPTCLIVESKKFKVKARFGFPARIQV
jgi:hypothetical protein